MDKVYYIDYFNNPSTGLSIQQSTLNWIYKLQYRTPEFMALIELGNSNFSTSEFNEIADKYQEIDYYLLTIQGKKSSSFIEKKQLINHLSFDFKHQINQVTKYDSIIPVLYHFENGFDALGEFRCLLGFTKQGINDKQIAIKFFDNDKNIEFMISSQAIASIPTLDI